MSENDIYLNTLLYGSADPLADLRDEDATEFETVAETLEKRALAESLTKAVAPTDWDAELTKTSPVDEPVASAEDFEKRSNARLEKVYAAFDKGFPNVSPELRLEARQTIQRMFEEVRALTLLSACEAASE